MHLFDLETLDLRLETVFVKCVYFKSKTFFDDDTLN